jgi:hypothetical protein
VAGDIEKNDGCSAGVEEQRKGSITAGPTVEICGLYRLPGANTER